MNSKNKVQDICVDALEHNRWTDYLYHLWIVGMINDVR
jgi:hypothetical protein